MPTKTYDGSRRRRGRPRLFQRSVPVARSHGGRDRRPRGVGELTDRHWQVIKFMRPEYEEKGTGPSVRALGKTSGVRIKELYQLFPKGPAKTGRQDRRDSQAARLHLTGRICNMADAIEKVSIIISKGSLEGVYPGLIMANGARAEGIEANLFFTFFGLDVIHKERHEHIKLATVGNPGLTRDPARRAPGCRRS